ncbi:putative integral membrane protein, partial [Streptomyces sparsogenes DSM 40356]
MRLKRVFMAPDPGRLRLRASARAVLGIGLAVAAVVAAGLPTAAAVTGGLAALLALFTVADPTVRGQAVT